MSSKKLYFLLVGLVILLSLGLIGATYAANTILTKQANKLTSLKAKSQALSEQQVSINKSKKDIEKYAELDKIAKAVVPEDKDQARAVREIVKIASEHNISLATISFPASNLGATSTVNPNAPASAAPSNASTNNKATALSQLIQVKNIPGVYQLQITVQSDSQRPVPYDSFISFLSALEKNRRTAQVSTISIEPNPNNRNLLSFNLTLNEYIKP